MSPRKSILRTLADRESGEGPGTYVRPATIPGFQEGPEKYQQAINALLKDRLIEGIRDPEGHLAISLNAHRARDVRKILRPIWAHPAVLTLLALVAAMAGMSFLA